MAIKQAFLAIVCKSYEGDIKSFDRLYKSLRRHNVDKIPFYVSVPSTDVPSFKQLVGDDVTLIADERYAASYFSKEEYFGLSMGYVNQEICKLSFWENGLADNYLFVDSDAYFIRDFYVSDFMASADTPYSVLVMDKDLNLQPYYCEFGEWRKSLIKKIFDEIGLQDDRLLTCHGMTVMNAAVLRDFKENFMEKRKLAYRDLIAIAPYEYTWYNAWLQKSGIIPVVAVEPFFKTFHMRIEYIMERLGLVTEVDLASQYVGIIMNSNWKPKKPPVAYQNPGMIYKLLNKLVNKVL